MQDNTTVEIMQKVGETLVDGFGRLAVRAECDGAVRVVSLPGTRYAINVMVVPNGTLHVSTMVGVVNWEHAGVADFLLRDNGRWVFGRFVRADDRLIIDHGLLVDGLVAEALQRCVMGIHHMALDAERTLEAGGLLVEDEEGSGE